MARQHSSLAIAAAAALIGMTAVPSVPANATGGFFEIPNIPSGSRPRRTRNKQTSRRANVKAARRANVKRMQRARA